MGQEKEPHVPEKEPTHRRPNKHIADFVEAYNALTNEERKARDIDSMGHLARLREMNKRRW